ncbi:MAG: LytTR family DNA-binding domain-containing protein [Saprospiraceae bacterium]|nr:LytTR family DNA-binding domain-containing protein [Saprospiraceae bacterium]
MLNTIIVDDEPLARDILETYIEQIPELNLIAKCSNALEANNELQSNKIDLMFLDIQMPQITGTDFLKSLSNPPMVVFTTAYPNYAIEGFELDALDYLLKPISLDRFMKAVNRALEMQQLLSGDTSETAEIVDNPNGEKDDFIFVKSDKKLIKIHYSEIIYIEGLKDYVIIRCKDSRVITLQTMKSLEAKMPSNIFKRIHRSYIVNLDEINALVGNMVEVTEKGQTKNLPIGKNYKDDLLEIVNKKRL